MCSPKGGVILEDHLVRWYLHLRTVSCGAGYNQTACSGSGGKSTWKTSSMGRKYTSKLVNNCLV